jgi:hypothetical protein
MMKAVWTTSIVCLCFALAFLFIWPYVTDPRAQGYLAAAVLQISRAVFGEHCLETYKIGNRQAAVAYARKIWRVEELKLTVLGDEDVAASIFKSELFRDGGDKDRDFSSASWQAGRSGSDSWHVSYSASSPAATAYLSAEFSNCGRVTNSASKVFSLKNSALPGRNPG